MRLAKRIWKAIFRPLLLIIGSGIIIPLVLIVITDIMKSSVSRDYPYILDTINEYRYWIALISALVFVILILIEVVRYIFDDHLRLRKYFNVYKPKEFTLEVAKQVLRFPKANKKFYSRARVMDSLKRLAAGDSVRNGILFKGPAGIGKSRLAYYLAREGFGDKKFERILIPKNDNKLKEALEDKDLAIPRKNIIILDDVEKYLGLERFKNVFADWPACFFVATMRVEEEQKLTEEGGVIADFLNRGIEDHLYKFTLAKLSDEEGEAAAEFLGDEAEGYKEGAQPPDTFSALVSDLEREYKVYVDNWKGKDEGFILEVLAFAIFSGFNEPPMTDEIPVILDILYEGREFIDKENALKNLKNSERIIVNKGRVDCRTEFLAYIYRGELEKETENEKYIEVAILRGVLALVILVEQSYNAGKTAMVSKALARTFELYSDKAETYFAAGYVNQKTNPEEAAKYYRRAFEINPDYVDAHNNYAMILIDNGKIDDAITHLETALNISTNYLIVHINYALLLSDKGLFREAHKHFRWGLRIDPYNAFAHINYANFLIKLGDKEHACEHYVEALRIDPDFSQVNGAYADFLARQGRCVEAREYAARFFELAPDHPNVEYLTELLDEKCPEE